MGRFEAALSFSLPTIWDKVQSMPGVLRAKDGEVYYRGVCLQCTSTSEDPLYGELDQRPPAALNQSERASFWNQIGENFAFIQRFFPKEVVLTRGRILVADPGYIGQPHIDIDRELTVQIPIETNQWSHLVLGGNEFHLKADGSVYLLDTRRQHFVYNSGPTARVHCVFGV